MKEETTDANEKQIESKNTTATNPITEARKLINGILTKSPLTKQNTVILLLSYFTLLILISVTLGLYNGFGMILLTNTITVITITKHEKGVISARTAEQKISYYGLAITFGFIGLYYLIHGLG